MIIQYTLPKCTINHSTQLQPVLGKNVIASAKKKSEATDVDVQSTPTNKRAFVTKRKLVDETAEVPDKEADSKEGNQLMIYISSDRMSAPNI